MFVNRYSQKDKCFPGSTPTINLSYSEYTCLTVAEDPVVVLNFKDNKSLEAIIPFLTGTKRLVITACRCTTLPESLGQLTQLTELYITFNGCLGTIPDIFGNLENLEKLSFEAAHIQTLPASIGQLKKLKELNLRRCYYLKTVPNELYSCTSLVTLWLTGSSIVSLSPLIEKLTNLQYLDIHDCRYLKISDATRSALWSLRNLEIDE